jgi:Alpha-L-arabinofuranosidase B, catalytic/Putative Ig domain
MRLPLLFAQTASKTLPLDLVPGAQAAYSLRRLRSTYKGMAVNVRRASDNAVQDIGFVAGEFDVASFNTFTAATTGFIAKWYDQSGNGRDALQATAANQPQIIVAGSPSGKTTARSASTSIGLVATVPAATTPNTLNAVASRTGNFTNYNVFFSLGNVAPGLYFSNSADGGISLANINTDIISPVVVPDAYHTVTGVMNTVSSFVTVDGVTNVGSLSDHPGSTTLDLFSTNLSNGFQGDMPEAIYYSKVLSAGAIAALESNQAAYYGFTMLGAAKFMTSTITTITASGNTISSISSLDTGRVGYVTAWGGSEYGYAYTYTLSGAPAGVSIDSDTGIISFASPVAAGTYTFPITATNRESPSVSSTFAYTMVVTTGVTTTQLGAILHKDYQPDSGTWGTPTAGDWTTVLKSMQTQIIADQAAAGEEQLHARILLRHATTYSYTDNTWADGIQYLTVRDDPAFLTGAKPILRNTRASGSLNVQVQPANSGTGGAMLHQSGGNTIKPLCALLETVPQGSSSVVLHNISDASKIVPGRWHVVLGQQTQLSGFPPNTAWNDYVKVVSVVGNVVNLDRPLKYRYDSTWWEQNTNVDVSFGRPWLVPWDLGGSAGAVPTDGRTTLRALWLNLTWATNPNNAGGTQSVVQHQNYIDISFENCDMLLTSTSMSKHVAYFSCSQTIESEPDKLSETILFDSCTTARQGGGTGYMYWLSRNTTHGAIQVCPRQFRMLNGNLDATGDTTFNTPFGHSFPGPMGYYDFEGVTFKRGTLQSQWAFAGDSDPANGNTPKIIIGTDASWSGNQLQIPSTFAHFDLWLGYVYEGMIINTTTAPVGTSWGYVDSLSSDGAGNTLYLNVVWVKGTKPLSGNIWAGGRFRRLRLVSCTLNGTTTYASPGYMKEQPGALGTTWDFPAGYPAKFRA